MLDELFFHLSLIDSFILLVSSGMPCRYGAGIGKFQRWKVCTNARPSLYEIRLQPLFYQGVTA